MFHVLSIKRRDNLCALPHVAPFREEDHVSQYFCQTPVVGLGLGVDFTFAWDNNDYNGNNDNNKNTPHLNFLTGTVLGVGIRDNG